MVRIASSSPSLSSQTPAPPAAAAPAVPAGPVDAVTLREEVVPLTQSLVRVDSSPANLVPGENATVDVMEAYALQAGLQVERTTTVRGRPMLVVTLPGRDPSLGTVGFVHHSDVVGIESPWKLGEPFSGKITQDAQGRQVLVGRGSVDTKGPAAQILVAMKTLKSSGQAPDRSMQLFVFPDEESGGREGAWHLARTKPEMFQGVQYWVVEGSGIMSREMLADVKSDTPYLAVAQKYSLPLQIVLKNPADPDQAVDKTLEALKRLDEAFEAREWTDLGDRDETDESFTRFGKVIGGARGWLLRNFWWTDFVRNRLGPELAAANRTALSHTDFYLSSNAKGGTEGPNVKPSSATVVVELALPEEDRPRALEVMRRAAGESMQVEPLEPLDNGRDRIPIRVTLPPDRYSGGNHGSVPDPARDAIDVTNAALDRIRRKLWWRGWAERLEVVDYYTSKSERAPATQRNPVSTHVTLDLRVAVDDDRQAVLQEVQAALGPEFEVRNLGGQEEMDASVRRLSHQSPLFTAAEDAIHETYGPSVPVLFGNTTASNDVRYLMEANPTSEALTFVPVLYTDNGAHGPDEAVTLDSLRTGVDWTVRFMERLGRR